MRDDDIAAAVERMVRAARLPGKAGRADLRRELLAHFEEAAAHGDADALARFGEEHVSSLFRRVYRRDYAAAYALKLAASVAASAVAALAIEVGLNIRVAAGGWRLGPGFLPSSMMAAMIVVAIVVAREAAKRPWSAVRAAIAVGSYVLCATAAAAITGSFGTAIAAATLAAAGYLCSTIEWRGSRVLATIVVFAAIEYGLHFPIAAFGPARAMAAGAILAFVWSATALILAHADRRFARQFQID